MEHKLFSKRFRRLYLTALLAVSLGLRLLAAPEEARTLTDRLRQADGSAVSAQAAEPAGTDAPQTETVSPAPETEPPTEAVEAISPAVSEIPEGMAAQWSFSDEEVEAVSMRNGTSYRVDKAALLRAPLPFTVPDSAPQVLVLHTHTTESYTPTAGDDYVPSGDYRTLDETHNMLAVGDVLCQALEAEGVRVLHDRSVNDYPSYNASYGNAKTRIETLLAENPSIVLVLDVHRDAADPPVREATVLDGASCAKLMLLVGTDEGGLYHPFWQENLSVALKLQAILERQSPGLARPLSLRKERFNGQTASGAFLVEVGSTGNTLDEARRAMPYLARAVAALLEGQPPS